MFKKKILTVVLDNWTFQQIIHTLANYLNC